MTTTPATTKSAALKAAPKPAAKRASKSSAKLSVVADVLPTADEIAAAVVETKTTRKPAAVKPAAKTTKRATKSTPAPVVESKPERVSYATSPSAAELIVRHEQMLAAIDAFESLVIVEVTAGVSPTAIGKLIGLGNSSVRRICMRRSPGLVK